MEGSVVGVAKYRDPCSNLKLHRTSQIGMNDLGLIYWQIWREILHRALHVTSSAYAGGAIVDLD